jgi:hypothetical protein
VPRRNSVIAARLPAGCTCFGDVPHHCGARFVGVTQATVPGGTTLVQQPGRAGDDPHLRSTRAMPIRVRRQLGCIARIDTDLLASVPVDQARSFLGALVTRPRFVPSPAASITLIACSDGASGARRAFQLPAVSSGRMSISGPAYARVELCGHAMIVTPVCVRRDDGPVDQGRHVPAMATHGH